MYGIYPELDGSFCSEASSEDAQRCAQGCTEILEQELMERKTRDARRDILRNVVSMRPVQVVLGAYIIL